MLSWSFTASFPFYIVISAASTSHAIIGGTYSGLFLLLQLGRCHIILMAFRLFLSWTYLVLGSLCLVCPGVLSSGLCLGCVLLGLDAPIVSRISSKVGLPGVFPLCFFMVSHIFTYSMRSLGVAFSKKKCYASPLELLYAITQLFLFLGLFCYARRTLLDHFSNVLVYLRVSWCRHVSFFAPIVWVSPLVCAFLFIKV